MIKRMAFSLLAILLLVATLCYAEGARNPTANIDGKSNFTSLGVQGLDASENPGYVELVGANPQAPLYYLFVDASGVLRLVSDTTMKTYGYTGGSSGTAASFPTGSWQNVIEQFKTQDATTYSDTIVGTQGTGTAN